MSVVHLILQGKGGVGKSLISTILAQHRLASGREVLCLDADPVNQTFAGFKALNVHQIHLMRNNEIDPGEFDKLFELVLEHEEDEAIIDNGASSFVPLSTYLLENDIIAQMNGMGKSVFIHTVVTGGPAMPDTLTGFDSLCRNFPDYAKIVVWVNDFFGEVRNGEQFFEEMKVYKGNKHRLHEMVMLRKHSRLFEDDFQRLLVNRMTFDEALRDGNADFKMLAQHRLRKMKIEIFEQLDLLFSQKNI